MKIFLLCFWLNEECPKLLSSLEIDLRRRKTIPLWNSTGEKRVPQGITVCLVSTILGTVWWPGKFQTVNRCQVLVFFYRHSTRMYLMKEKQGGPIQMATQALQASHRHYLCFAISSIFHDYLSAFRASWLSNHPPASGQRQGSGSRPKHVRRGRFDRPKQSIWLHPPWPLACKIASIQG